MTLGELLRVATARLAAAGVPSPRVDAELLAADWLGIERAQLSTRTGEAVDPQGLEPLLARREAREPLQHILGRTPFRHLMLAVGPGVFIPRPETELLVDAALARLREHRGAPLVVDLCSGSGALAVSVATELPGSRVVAVEREPDALPWLRRNAAGTQVSVVAGDAADPELLAELRGTVDVVLANPPYVPAAAIVDVEVRADPAAAVFGGVDGLALLPHVIARAAEWLRPGGMFAMEHEASQGEVAPELLRMDGRWLDIADHRDLAGRPRYVTAVRS
ncbi:MAG: release factor glutamine methyltransferase [Pseudonocardiales bacterium]|nr:release factor glutamine methyltransferase [Pseudonocardiales bacterium]